MLPETLHSASRAALLAALAMLAACLLFPTGTARAQEESGTIAAADSSERLNVLMIVVDDMNDWVGYLDGYPGAEPTPHIDALARRGVAFRNAHAPSTQCAPSRAAILTGLMPYSSGIYSNAPWWRPVLPERATLPELFRQNGYRAVGAGKVFHHTLGNNPPDVWDHYEPQVQDSRWHYAYPVPGQHRPKPGGPHWPEGFPLNALESVREGRRPPANYREFDWGPFDEEDLEMGDGHAVRFGMDFLAEAHAEPFFLAVGLYRPHLPWYAPRPHFEALPPDAALALPELPAGDLEDVPLAGRNLRLTPGMMPVENGFEDYDYVQETGTRAEAARAYLASIRYADALVGRLVAALDSSRHAENTVVVLWSDHGFHLGEKQHWHKSTLWPEATHVPFVIAGPGVAGGATDVPVSLIDLYPTLAEWCGLDGAPRLDGQSLASLLIDPSVEVARVAVTNFLPGNYAVRSARWHYIRYADGSEELYDHRADPSAWTNLADDSRYGAVKTALRARLPTEEAAPAPRRTAFDFDPATYTWTRRSDGTVIR